jgi:lambda family phage portal protein
MGYINPRSGLRRLQARTALDQSVKAATSGYEADTPSRGRKFYTSQLSPNQLTGKSAVILRTQARQMQRNNDLARGILRTMVNNIVGPNGIGIEPQPRRADGSIHEDYAKALRDAWRDWQRVPEVTGRHTFAKVQRLMAMTWLRDGESFAQELMGAIPGLTHGTKVPFSLEMFEPDFVPYYYSQGNVQQGIERNAWGKPTAFMVYKNNPMEVVGAIATDLKRVSADRVHHIALLDRIGQMRGITEFASIIGRLEDIKDYEESERVAAKISAALTAYVKKTSLDGYAGPNLDANGDPAPRSISMAPGMVIDSLAVGEEIGLIDSNRPNPNVITFRQGQLRAVAAGVGASYSSIARDYNGTFSAQRQELVEQWVNYATLTDEFVGQFIQPVWASFVMACDLSGAVKIPRDVVPGSQDDALFLAQTMPWIDPAKEAAAYVALVRAGFASEVEVIRKRGGNPRDLLEQVTQWRKEAESKGLIFSSNAEYPEVGGVPEPAAAAGEVTDEQIAASAQAKIAAESAARAEYAARSAAQAQSAAQLEASTQTTAALAAAVATIAARESAAPIINNHIGLPTPVVNVENQVQPTAVEVTNHFEATVPAAQVVMQHPTRAVQVVERDAATDEITQTVTTYEVDQ